MNEFPDDELVNLANDKNETANDILYDKYSYIIDIIYNKFKKSAYYLSVDLVELKQEAMLGFSDALASYNQDKEANLSTFISLVIERRLTNYIRKADTAKNRILKSTLSLDVPISEEDQTPLIENIGNDNMDPQIQVEELENIKNLKKKIDELLSPNEKQVYELLINDFSYEDIASILNISIKAVYNTAARLRAKIKDIL